MPFFHSFPSLALKSKTGIDFRLHGLNVKVPSLWNTVILTKFWLRNLIFADLLLCSKLLAMGQKKSIIEMCTVQSPIRFKWIFVQGCMRGHTQLTAESTLQKIPTSFLTSMSVSSLN